MNWIWRIWNGFQKVLVGPKFRTPTGAVISVGNLTFGGTGKSPLVRFLCEIIRAKHPDSKVAVIVRSYRARQRAPVFMNGILKLDPRQYGDEPLEHLLMLREFGIDVYCGSKKRDILKYCSLQKQYDFFLVDDGFHHYGIEYDKSFVLIDTQRPVSSLRLFPFGQMRAPWVQFAEARPKPIVLFTRADGANPKEMLGYQKIFENHRVIDLNFETLIPDGLGDHVFVLTAIGHPKNFVNAVGQKFKVLGEAIFPDHHFFSWEELNEVQSQAQRLGATWIATTMKDFVKIDGFSDRTGSIPIVPIPVQCSGAAKAALESVLFDVELK